MKSGFLEHYRAEAGDVLDAILTNSRDCIKLLNLRGELEYVSASAKNALGLADISEAIGKSWSDYWPASERPALDGAILAASGGTSARFEGATHGAEGEQRIWVVTVSPVRGESGAVTHLLAVSTDVTAERDAHLRLERAEEEVSFAGDVARELRHRIKNQLAVAVATGAGAGAV